MLTEIVTVLMFQKITQGLFCYSPMEAHLKVCVHSLWLTARSWFVDITIQTFLVPFPRMSSTYVLSHSFQAQHRPGILQWKQLCLHLLYHLSRDPSTNWLLEDGKKPSRRVRRMVNKSGKTIFTWEEGRRERQASPRLSFGKSPL